ncbi:MAG: hypothetical protein KC457_28040 [Myxococcales bacterium]|nr:hypothetical protein [Myxococcales bacterium]
MIFDEADDTAWPDDLTWSGSRSWRTAGYDADWLDSVADDPATFWLGTHQVNWAWSGVAMGPLFLSARRLAGRVSAFPRAEVPVAIDSGGFTEVTMLGGWKTSPQDYVALVRRASRELGTVAWAAIQDWMCEDVALQATGLQISDHQRLTVESYQTLVDLAPEVRWLPVVQGQTVDDYLRCIELYDRCGVDLRAHQMVGLGSVCRRQAAAEIRTIVGELAGRGLRLHGFGVKALGLAAIGDLLCSADSLAWSYNGRLLTREHGQRDSQGRGLANSPEHAEKFRDRMLELIREALVVLDDAGSVVQLCLPFDLPEE